MLELQRMLLTPGPISQEARIGPAALLILVMWRPENIRCTSDHPGRPFLLRCAAIRNWRIRSGAKNLDAIVFGYYDGVKLMYAGSPATLSVRERLLCSPCNNPGFAVYSRRGSTMSISFVLAIIALILAIVSGTTGKAPLWIAVALLALALIVPGIPMK